jgi:biotin transport system substrate-specific component
MLRSARRAVRETRLTMAHAQTPVFAERILPGEGLLWEAARLLSGNLLMVLCAHIAIPIPGSPVPLTGQTFGVLLLALLFGARRSALVMGLYLLEGAAGLPVFQPLGAPGALRLVGPTAGYLWSYPAVAYLAGWLGERANWSGASANAFGTLKLCGAVLLGHALMLASGWAWLAAVPHLRADGSIGALGWTAAWSVGVAPFLLDALLKTALVIGAAKAVGRARAN